jgi:hypothetical protein
MKFRQKIKQLSTKLRHRVRRVYTLEDPPEYAISLSKYTFFQKNPFEFPG